MSLLPKLVFTFLCLTVFSGCQSSSSDEETPSTTRNAYNLTLTIESDSSSNSIQINPLEKSCATACVERIDENTQIELIPIANNESEFVGWSGDCSNTENCQLTINSDKKVNGIFKAKTIQKTTHKLHINIIGEGSLSINNSIAACDSSCSFEYDLKTQLTLGAIAKPNYQFSFWKDTVFGCNTEDTCVVTMNDDVRLTIVFEKSISQNHLTLDFLGSGLGEVGIVGQSQSCNSDCQIALFSNDAIELFATAAEGSSVFSGWSGCDEVVNGNCRITSPNNPTVSASFDVIEQPALSINIVGDGTGEVGIVGQSISCTSNCQIPLTSNNQIELYATAAEGTSVFSGWNGCDQEAVNGNCIVVSPESSTITANFDAVAQTTLSISIDGSGTGEVGVVGQSLSCSGDCQLTLPSNDPIELYATATEGTSTFSGWSGCDEVVNGNCRISSSANTHTISASFDIIEQVTLSINIIGEGVVKSGSGDINCSESCQVEIVKDTSIELLAVANSGHELAQWNNNCTTNISCELTMSAPLELTVSFRESTFDRDSNAILITEPLGETRTNHPVQIGRPFVKGEIANFPVAVINDVVVPTQANIKQRYDDGSVKHAIISFVIDSLPAHSSLTVKFENQTTMSQSGMSKAEMLNANTQFSASMSFDFPESEPSTVSAENMINNDHYDVWYEGEIATSILIRDHSEQRNYDVGNDAHRSIRPMFYVTFWPTIDKYQVRYLVENSNTMTLQDQLYDVQLSIDSGASPFYSKDSVPHQTMSRWTKSQWSGTQISPVSIDHNVKYLAKTKAIANFDTNLVVSEDVIALDWEKWQSKDKDIYDKGLWQSAMGVAGGRPDIGLYPSWTVKWLFTGDWRHQEISLAQSELAGAWPMHLREGDTGRKFDFDESIDALGKVISMAPKARPTHWTSRPDWHEIDDNDKLTFVGDHPNSLWRPDNAHHPDIATPQYLLTGDYFYLEEMIHSAAFVSGNNNAKAGARRYGRGPTGSEGALYSGEVRGQAWAMRTRFYAVDILPDDMHEKAYFNRLNENAIAMFEGLFNLENSYPEKAELYNFVKNEVIPYAFSEVGGPSPLGFWDLGATSANYVNDEFVNTEEVSRAIAPWMQNFVIAVLGRGSELGYSTNNLLNYASQTLHGPFAHADLPHAMFSSYILPTINTSSTWMTSWIDVYGEFNADYVSTMQSRLANESDTEHGYYSIGMSAASYLQSQENFDALWSFIEANVKTKSAYNNNPKWALVPRVDN